ncbi:hypothetical protein [uncultured Aquimarina sp.]|uniref:hypothetical protein n=1 Tax=uncultured Aquimarina sp. TaxID=575652 RepID=UPI002610BFA5|nr:hypothetical protein [uncultured Aquimarina sp.]
MNWKLIGVLAVIVLLLVITSIIVWNNRTSDKLVSSFISVLILGSIGLLITSLVSLKKEVYADKFPAVLFIELEPLSLPLHKKILKKEGSNPGVATNSAINRILKDSILREPLINQRSKDYDKFIEDLFIRYVFDLLTTKYMGHWYLESTEFKMPNSLMTTSIPADSTLQSTSISWKKISKMLPTNQFTQIGWAIDAKTEKLISVDINFPPKTKIEVNAILNGFIIELENDFVKLDLEITRVPPIGVHINDEIANAFSIPENRKTNFRFQPFLFKHTLTKKKFKIGHPEMSKYEYWANDVILLLKRNLSVEEFWRVVKLNA